MKPSMDGRRIEGKRTRLASQIETDRRTSVKNELHVRSREQTAVQSWRTSRHLHGPATIFYQGRGTASHLPMDGEVNLIKRLLSRTLCLSGCISVKIPKAGDTVTSWR